MRWRASFDKPSRDVDRIVITPGQIFDGACDRLIETVRQFCSFRNWYRAAVEVFGALIEDSFEHEGHGDAARGHRRSNTGPGRYGQFNQCIQAAKPPALRLI